MKELSLHILDIVQNSISAKASFIEVFIGEYDQDNLLKISIKDNGCGMSAEMVAQVTNPFVTTRKTRKVGLGISLFKAAAERSNGCFVIDSVIGEGTSVIVEFEKDHIDLVPIGDMSDTMSLLIMSNPDIDFSYTHSRNEKTYAINTMELRNVLGEVPLDQIDVVHWIRESIKEGLSEI